MADAQAVDPTRTVSLHADHDVVAFAKDDVVRQALANVIGNALVHTAAGSPIDTSAIISHGRAVIDVADHGRGIEPHDLVHVTERFYRTEHSRAHDRHGGGLSIVNSEMLARGGALEPTSTVGEGTTVRLLFPLSTSKPNQQAATSEEFPHDDDTP